ncbi:hypothetical protein R1sor_010529 [Riccia sorocarpa]|uniref:Uncharacterized protein n=1 Tax=Riccia sorocarpa TaxID=122646 RepID=A0ABD3HYA3_9MARC
MSGRRKPRGYTRPPLPTAHMMASERRIIASSAEEIPVDSPAYVPLPTPGDFPLPSSIWELSPGYTVPGHIWTDSPGYMPGPNPGYNPIPPVETPGYASGPSPRYAPVPAVGRPAVQQRPPVTPAGGVSEIVGPIILPHVEEEVETIVYENNVGTCSPEYARRPPHLSTTKRGTDLAATDANMPETLSGGDPRWQALSQRPPLAVHIGITTSKLNRQLNPAATNPLWQPPVDGIIAVEIIPLEMMD